MTPDEAAAWIVTKVRATGCLDHAEVVDQLDDMTDLVGYNDAGNPVVSKSVLGALRRLNPADIVWSRGGQHWRLREADDPAGRLAP